MTRSLGQIPWSLFLSYRLVTDTPLGPEGGPRTASPSLYTFQGGLDKKADNIVTQKGVGIILLWTYTKEEKGHILRKERDIY